VRASPSKKRASIELGLLSVAADGFDRATGKGFLAEAALFVGLRLLVEEGMTTVVIALEVSWRGLAAEVTINALVIYIVGTGNVL
jgi:hypothetical protein